MKRHNHNKFSIGSIVLIICLVWSPQLNAKNKPDALETIVTEDGSTWERISEFGFGNAQNLSIVSLCGYRNNLYALTRNEVSGCEIWRTNKMGWEKVNVPGFTDSILHDKVNGAYGKLIKFKKYLYVAVSSGGEGAYLYRSIGCELWRFDGKAWEPVISNSIDEDEAGAITALSGCESDDGDTTAEITDAGKNWIPGEWAGGVLRITSGEGKGRVFDIVDNTPNSLVVQQNEIANADEDTICAAFIPDPTAPHFFVGAIAVDDTYEIGVGEDENGFGEPWNKTIIDLAVYNGELYIPIGHNYEAGTRIWKTSNGVTWTATSDYSFGQFHGYDLDGNPTDVCLVPGSENQNGKPVSSSATHFGKSDVSGTETLYIGATGTTGCNGRGARALWLVGDSWEYIVDNFVDENDVGTNENGLGDAASFLTGNFQVWSWAEYDEKLFASIARQSGGGRVIYSETGGPEDGAWTYVVGKDAPLMAEGFDGVSGMFGFGSNIGSNLYSHENALYAGTLMLINGLIPSLPGDPLFDGADIWRATGPAEALVWTRVTGDGFGDTAIHHFNAFCTYGGALHVGASNLFGAPPQQVIPTGAQGGVVYRLKKVPQFVSVSAVSAGIDSDGNPTITWSTDSEENSFAGFNVYRSGSEAQNDPYVQINGALIPAAGAGSSYAFTDDSGIPGTYYFKIDGINNQGGNKVYGPYGPLVKQE